MQHVFHGRVSIPVARLSLETLPCSLCTALTPSPIHKATSEVVKASLYRLLDLLAAGVLCGSRHL